MNLSNSLLDNFRIGPGLGESAHVHQVGTRKPLHLGERRAQVMRQPFNHLRTPPLQRLLRQNVAPHLPIQQYQLAIHRQRSALLGGVDAGFQTNEPVGVARRHGCQRNGLIAHVLRMLNGRQAGASGMQPRSVLSALKTIRTDLFAVLGVPSVRHARFCAGLIRLSASAFIPCALTPESAVPSASGTSLPGWQGGAASAGGHAGPAPATGAGRSACRRTPSRR